MYFRERLENIMEDANLPKDDRNFLVEKLTQYVLAHNALAGLEDKSIKDVLKKLEDADLLDELKELLEEKTHLYAKFQLPDSFCILLILSLQNSYLMLKFFDLICFSG